MKILLIEDNLADVHLITELLKKSATFPFDIDSCTRLSEGLDYIQNKDVDIILLDLTLPDSDKESTLTSILDYTSKYPIIILTGLNDKEIALNSLQKGIQDYLVKGELNETILTRSILYSIERHKIKVEIIPKKEIKSLFDSKDKMILNILQENYKISYKEISERVHLAASTIHNRVQKMVNDGIIEEFNTLVDPYEVGYETIAIISLSVDPLKMNDMANELKIFEEIQLIAATAGDYNLILQIIAENEKELWKFINEKIKSILGIRTMNVSSFIEIFKKTPKIKFKIEN
ncbi:MAG: response regulator [Promethearchaeota archaeon]